MTTAMEDILMVTLTVRKKIHTVTGTATIMVILMVKKILMDIPMERRNLETQVRLIPPHNRKPGLPRKRNKTSTLLPLTSIFSVILC